MRSAHDHVRESTYVLACGPGQTLVRTVSETRQTCHTMSHTTLDWVPTSQALACVPVPVETLAPDYWPATASADAAQAPRF